MYRQRFYTILGILKSPGQALQEICSKEDRYLVSSVIILILGSLFAVDMASGPLDESIASVKQFGVGVSYDPVYWITSTIFGLVENIVLIAIIFMISKKLGGFGSFKKIFVGISHATLPVVIGGIIITAVFFTLSSTMTTPEAIGDAESEFQYFGMVSYLGVVVPLSIWSLIIAMRALKIVNGFGAGKALGIILLASIVSFVVWIPLYWLPI